MNKNFCAVLAVALFLGGCSMVQPTLDERGVVKIETRATSPVFISNAHAYQDGHDLVVEGDAEFPMTIHDGIFGGHVDIAVMEPGKNALVHHDINVTERRIPKTIGRRAFFVTRFHVIPTTGTTIRISYIG